MRLGLWLAVVLGIACSKGGSGAQEGELEGHCYGNGTCDMGLACVGNFCVEAIGDEGNPCYANGTCNGALACVADVCMVDVDAGLPDADTSDAVVSTSCGGELPIIDGEFLLALDTPVAPGAALLFAATTTTDATVSPSTISLSLQPICTLEAQCTVGNHIGSPIVVAAADLDESCEFTATITAGSVPGGANSISGSALTLNLELLGSLDTVDFYCGMADGTATVGGADIFLDNSTFGSKSMPTGTMGNDLPPARLSCQVEI